MTAHAIGDQQTGNADYTRDSGNHVSSTMQAVRDGANETQEYVSGALPAVTEFVSRLVYTSCYGVSYGVMFPVFVVARMIPKENALVHGLIDGANAAREQVDGWGGGSMENHLPEGDEPESSDHDGESVAEQDGQAPRQRRGPRRGGAHKATRSHRKSES